MNAVAKALWLEEPQLEKIWPILLKTVSAEESLTVRMNVLKALAPVYNHSRDCFREALQLLTTPRGRDAEGHELYPLAGYEGVDLSRYISATMPEIALDLMERMMRSGDDLLDHVGSRWAMVHAFNHDVDPDKIEALKVRSEGHLRLWVELLCQFAVITEFRNFAIEELGAFFDHDDVEVRKTASGIFRRIKPSELRHFKKLASNYVHSKAFLDGGYGFYKYLETSQAEMSELILSAAEILIKSLTEKGDQFGSRGMDLHRMQDLLRKEYLASEGKPDKRSRLLDIIDKMIENRLYGADELLSLGER